MRATRIKATRINDSDEWTRTSSRGVTNTINVKVYMTVSIRTNTLNNIAQTEVRHQKLRIIIVMMIIARRIIIVMINYDNCNILC